MAIGLGVGLPFGPSVASSATLMDINAPTSAYRIGGSFAAAPSGLPGWSFTRASTGASETNAGLIVQFASGAPRITDRGLLVEEARSNGLRYSQEFSNAVWSKTDVAVTDNATLAPDGVMSADLVTEGAAGTAGVLQGCAIVGGVAQVASLCVKRGNNDWLRLRLVNGSATVNMWVNLATGAVGQIQTPGNVATNAVGGALPLANGFYRFWVSAVLGSETSANLEIFSAGGDGLFPRSANAAYSIWQADIQAGAAPLSPILTTNAIATRATDVAVISDLAVPPTHSGVVRFRWAGRDTTGFPQAIQLDDGTNNNRVAIYRNNSIGTGTMLVVVGGVTVAAISLGDLALDVEHSIAWRCKAGGYGVSVNGGAVASSAAAAALPSLANWRAAQSVGNAIINAGNGALARCAIYLDAPSDAALRARSSA